MQEFENMEIKTNYLESCVTHGTAESLLSHVFIASGFVGKRSVRIYLIFFITTLSYSLPSVHSYL